MKNHTIFIVCSSGGHLIKSFLLKSWWKKYHRTWITRDDSFSKSLLKNEIVIYGYFPENRNLLNFLLNLLLAFRCYLKNKPDLVFSNGAGIAPPFFIMAKLFGIKTVFMETFILSPNITLSGRIIYKLTNYFIVQNIKLLKQYPKGLYFGVEI